MMDKSILEAVHDSAKDLYQTGVMDEITMRDFDALCLLPVGSTVLNKSGVSSLKSRARQFQQ